jgi:hypothetical protein
MLLLLIFGWPAIAGLPAQTRNNDIAREDKGFTLCYLGDIGRSSHLTGVAGARSKLATCLYGGERPV